VTTDVGGTSAYLVHGTCRAGSDPRTSVVDPFCRVHALQNLYVVDGSFMPTSGGASTTLTIAANALRTAERILGKS
jgi:choline dehydrogenase-like flavoprotein